MAQIFTNNAIARITGPITASANIINIDPARASLFPNPTRVEDWFLITLDDITDPDVFEIVKIGSRTGSQLNVVQRGFESSGAKNWGIDDTICDHRLTAGTLDSFLPVVRVNGFNVNPAAIQYIDSMSVTPNNSMMKWQVTLMNLTSGKLRTFEIHAVYKSLTSTLTWNKFSIIGDSMDVLVAPELNLGLIKLKVTNNEPNIVTVNTTRIRHL